MRDEHQKRIEKELELWVELYKKIQSEMQAEIERGKTKATAKIMKEWLRTAECDGEMQQELLNAVVRQFVVAQRQMAILLDANDAVVAKGNKVSVGDAVATLHEVVQRTRRVLEERKGEGGEFFGIVPVQMVKGGDA